MSGRGRGGGFMERLPAPTGMAVGRLFKVRPGSPQGADLSHCRAAEQAKRLEPSMGKRSVCVECGVHAASRVAAPRAI